jgi:signal peptidase
VKIPRLADTGEWTTRRYVSLLGTILIWIIVAIDAWYLWPSQLGGDTSIVVVSGESMEPTFYGGDMVIARKMEPSVGDAIVYAPEALDGSQIVHRIIGGSADEGWQMQGDNNDFVDPFTPRGAEVKGVVLVHYSNFGRVTVLLLNPMVWAFVLLAAMVLMLWYTGDDCDEKEDDDGENEANGEDDGDPESELDDEPDLIDRVVEGTEAAVSRMVASIAGAGAAAFAMVTRRVRVLRPVSLVPARVFAILGVVGMLAVSSMSPASASQLTVNTGRQASVMAHQKCAPQTLAAEATGPHQGINYEEVTVTGVSLACSGLPVTIYLHDSNGLLLELGSGTTASPSTAVSFPRFHTNKVDEVVVKIDGWLFLASWL